MFRRPILAALALAALAAAASAQMSPVILRPVTPVVPVVPVLPIAPPTTEAVSSDNPGTIDACATVEMCKRALDKAMADRSALRTELNGTQGRLSDAMARIDQMTKLGGSLVKAYCESETMSKSTAGASEDCATSGYRCSSVEGTCYRQCNVSTECAGGFVCDTGVNRCVRTG